MHQCSAAMSQQQQQVLPEHNGGDLKRDFPLSLRFEVEAAGVLPCSKSYTTTCFGTLKCTMPDADCWLLHEYLTYRAATDWMTNWMTNKITNLLTQWNRVLPENLSGPFKNWSMSQNFVLMKKKNAIYWFFGGVYLEVAFFWGMTLHHWAIGSRRFETM